MNQNDSTAPASARSLEPAGETVQEVAADADGSLWARIRSLIRENLATIALALLIFFVIRAAVQTYRVDGFSMEPNFHSGQYVLVNKLDYRLRAPERGEVVIFKDPPEPERELIKRIIALPADTVEVREGRVYVNGQLQTQTYDTYPASYSVEPTVVGPDQLFVLGDNRNNSTDSHSWGMLPRSHWIGRAWLSLWPLQYWGVIETPSFIAAAVGAQPPSSTSPLASPAPIRPTAYP